MKLMALVLALGILGGCGLTQEQQARIKVLSEKNKALALQVVEVYEKVKAGTLSAAEAVVAVSAINDALKANEAEIEKLKSEGASFWVIAAGLLGMFGRTILHGAAKVPVGGPVGIAIQAVLGFLLGGSSTNKSEPAKT